MLAQTVFFFFFLTLLKTCLEYEFKTNHLYLISQNIHADRKGPKHKITALWLMYVETHCTAPAAVKANKNKK